MKNLKKLLALMLVLAMCVCVFAACGDEPAPAKDNDDEKVSDTEKDKEKDTDGENDEDEDNEEDVADVDAEYVAKYFMDAYIGLDMDKMEKYYAVDDDFFEEMELTLSEYGDAIRAMMARSSYKIKAIDEYEDLGTATAYILMTAPIAPEPDVDAINSAELMERELTMNLEIVDGGWKIVGMN